MEKDSINIKIEETEGRNRKAGRKKARSFSIRNFLRNGWAWLNDWRVRDRKIGMVDLPFFFIVTILLVMGIIMMFSASYAWAIGEGEKGIYYAQRQMYFGLGGLLAMFLLSKVDYHIFNNIASVAVVYGTGFIMLLLVKFTPLGREYNEARRWINLGGPIEFQPSEIMKFAIIITFSYLIVSNQSRIKDFKKGLIPFFVLLVPVLYLLMKQPHLSCTIIIAAISLILIYIGGARFKHIAAVTVAGILALGGLVLYKINHEGVTYFVSRFRSWLKPFSDTTGVTWQTDQSLIAIGSGGFFGMGLGNSRQKFMYLPESKNDFVFSIVCEELGFVGAVTVILLFAFFVFRGFYIASKAPDRFGMLVCIGITLQVGLQAFLNIAVVSNLVPNTGISLPFFSYGGTSLLMLLGEVGVVMNISRQILETPEDIEMEKRAQSIRKARKRARKLARKKYMKGELK